MPLANGAVFAGYTIARLLGSGGMGEVYLVKHPRLPRRDALKVLPESMTADSEFRERFYREADVAARLFHPYIVGVHDRGEFDDGYGSPWTTSRAPTPRVSCGTDIPLACLQMKR